MSKSTYEKLNQMKIRLSAPNKPASIEELAEYMDCDSRTIYRYIDTLDAENCGLVKDKQTRRFSIQPVAAHRPEAIIRGLKSVQKVLDGMGTSAHSRNVKRTIDYLCGDATAEEVSNHAINVDSDFVVDLGPFSEYSENLSFRETEIDKFLDAIKQRAKLSITYIPAREDGREEKYEVCPLKLVLRIDTLFLVGNTDDGIRLFAVRRIKNFRKTGAFFPEMDFNYKSLYTNCFGKFSSKNFEKIKVVLEVKSYWLQAQFSEAHFNPPIKIRKQKPFTVELNVYDTPDFESWLLGNLPDLKVLEPSELKKNLKEKLKKASEAL